MAISEVDRDINRINGTTVKRRAPRTAAETGSTGYENIEGELMAIQTRPTPAGPDSPVREAGSPPMPPRNTGVQIVELPSRFRTPEPQPAAVKVQSLPAKIAHGVWAFYDWLSGPATSNQERMRAGMADAENVLRAVRGARMGAWKSHLD